MFLNIKNLFKNDPDAIINGGKRKAIHIMGEPAGVHVHLDDRYDNEIWAVVIHNKNDVIDPRIAFRSHDAALKFYDYVTSIIGQFEETENVIDIDALEHGAL